MQTADKERGGVRAPMAAGLYYPKDADGLRRALRTLLGTARETSSRLPKALIVPHAGYAYSGSVAAAAYRTLASSGAGAVRHVVLLGPSHRVPMRGLAMPTCGSFSTPLGEVPINRDARRRLRELGLAGLADPPHAHEHALEVQVPFLQVTLRDFDLLPVAVGQAPAEQVGRALGAVWGGPDTLVVVTSDLSHHHTCLEARALDQQTARAILARRSDLSDTQACAADGINGLMEVARHRGLEVQLLDCRSSGEAAGDDSRVVGYGSFALHAPVA